MPTLRAYTIMSVLTLSGLLTPSSALSLSNFTPRIENLPSQCQSIYVRNIEGCQKSDFTPRPNPDDTCSDTCINGLVKIMKLVESECATVDVPETSIIGVFLLGQGIPALCPNIVVTTVKPTSTTATPAPETSSSSSQDEESQASTTTTEAPSSTTTDSANSSTTTTTTTTTTESTSADGGGIAIDTTVPTTLATTFPDFSGAPLPSATSTSAVSQNSNEDSGGGSPFDVVAGSASGTSVPLRGLVVGVLAIAFAVALG